MSDKAYNIKDHSTKARNTRKWRLLLAVCLVIVIVVGAVIYTNYTSTDAYYYKKAEKCIELQDYNKAFWTLQQMEDFHY